MQQFKITQDGPDDHIWQLIECEGRPAINFDVTNSHGRRVLSVRVDGMTVASHLLDVEYLEPKGDAKTRRYCPFCGKEIWLLSKGHECNG